MAPVAVEGGCGGQPCPQPAPVPHGAGSPLPHLGKGQGHAASRSETPSGLTSSFRLAGMPGHQVIQMLDKGYRLPQPPTCPAPLYQLMLQCWSAEAGGRPTFETLCEQLETYFETESSSYAHTQAVVK